MNLRGLVVLEKILGRILESSVCIVGVIQRVSVDDGTYRVEIRGLREILTIINILLKETCCPKIIYD